MSPGCELVESRPVDWYAEMFLCVVFPLRTAESGCGVALNEEWPGVVAVVSDDTYISLA